MPARLVATTRQQCRQMISGADAASAREVLTESGSIRAAVQAMSHRAQHDRVLVIPAAPACSAAGHADLLVTGLLPTAAARDNGAIVRWRSVGRRPREESVLLRNRPPRILRTR